MLRYQLGLELAYVSLVRVRENVTNLFAETNSEHLYPFHHDLINLIPRLHRCRTFYTILALCIISELQPNLCYVFDTGWMPTEARRREYGHNNRREQAL